MTNTCSPTGFEVRRPVLRRMRFSKPVEGCRHCQQLIRKLSKSIIEGVWYQGTASSSRTHLPRSELGQRYGLPNGQFRSSICSINSRILHMFNHNPLKIFPWSPCRSISPKQGFHTHSYGSDCYEENVTSNPIATMLVLHNERGVQYETRIHVTAAVKTRYWRG